MTLAMAPRPVVRALGACALLALSVVGAGHARADVGPIHPDLVTQTALLQAAKGPEAYAALRDVWRLWDRADPTQVEAAIGNWARAPDTAAPLRVYAGLLEAYARRRRGDFDGATLAVQKLGFVGRWLAVGPFDNEGKAGLSRVFAPEQELAEPIVLGRAYDGKERPVRWRAPPEGQSYGWFDFGDLMRPRENMCGYATTFVRAKAGTRAPRPVTLWVGASGAFKVYWNGVEVLRDAGYRDIDIDRFATEVRLAPGSNRVTIKVCGDEDAPKFALRIGDERGAPDLDLDVTADATASLDLKNAVARRVEDKPAGPPVAKGRVLGPLQELARRVEGAKPRAEDLHAFARYLALTGGDAKTEHLARDLASRAAEAKPSVPTLLLAAALAEDKNQRQAWVGKARELVGAASRDVDVLLAEAALARDGTSWRDAMPLYERALAIDPDSVEAILGRVDLLAAAGLKRTAIAALGEALVRQPSAVALLRVYAGELRAIGRETEAFEAEARYAALRFDDAGFLGQQVELAVARRDAAGAERWLGRLLRSEPDSAWVRDVAARTYRSLGQRARALAAYERALAMAPEDAGTLRALSDLHGEDGDRERQIELLRQIARLHPQAKEVREYLEHVEPPKARMDEAYAWAPERFLPMRSAKPEGYPRRTLRNLNVTTVYPNGLASHFRQVVFQPLTDEAAASGREYAFSYQGDREVVQLRAAKVYRADGKIDEAIESGEAPANDPSMAMYTSTRTFYVHFPRLNAGDIVELRYRVEDTAPRNEVADSFGEIEYLQSDEPLASSEYVLITPKARTFYVAASKLPGLVRESTEEGDRRIERFVATNVAPLGAEPAMPPWSEALAHVHVSTFASWHEVGAFYWGLVREQLDVDDEVRRKVKELTKGLTDDRAKVRAIYKYATQTRYVALEFGIEGIKPRRCAQTLARGWGDCKDKATLIVTMLRELGIDATLVLVRTGMRGNIEPVPASLAPFDHAIAYVPSLDLYLDGTAENTGSTELPPMDRGAVALQINEGQAKLVRLPNPPARDSVARRRIGIDLARDGSAELAVDAQITGAYAVDWRQRYVAEGARRERATRDLATDLGPVELGRRGVELSDLADTEQPVRFQAKGRAVALARREGDTLSLPASPSLRMVAQYASLSTRTLDVVLPALTLRDEEWVVKLPAGTRVVAAPTPVSVDSAFGTLQVEVEQAPGKVVVKSSFALKKARITPLEYPAWRSFCEAVDRAFGQRIVVGR
jgi:tetratricopeptide (TPR) repeat protein/transglutaminase-like putative cysteine protease